MKTARLPILSVLVLFAACAYLPGCASVLPGNDPVVVHAQQTIAIGTDGFDTFLKSEDQTHDAFCQVSPSACAQSHSFAEFLKTKVSNGVDVTGTPVQTRRAKMWLQTATHLTDVYKDNRTPENKANLDTILNTITAAVAEAQKYLLKFKAVKGP